MYWVIANCSVQFSLQTLGMETQLTETSGAQKEVRPSQITFSMTFYAEVAASSMLHTFLDGLPRTRGVPVPLWAGLFRTFMGQILQLAAEISASHYATDAWARIPHRCFLSLRLKNTHACTKPSWQMQMPLRHQRTWKHTWKLGLAQPAQWNHFWAQLLSRYLYPSWAQLSYRQIRMKNIQQTELGQTVLPWRKGLQSYPVWCKHVI